MKPNSIIVTAKSMALLFLLSLVLFSGCDDREAIEIYVAVEGDDAADGSITKPYASLPHAVNQVRSLRESGNSDPAVIYLREGRHQLNETLVLGLEDGLSAEVENEFSEEAGAGDILPAHLTIAAYPGEAPVVSAGVPVTGWKILDPVPAELPANAAGKVWVADMPEGLGRFYTLYDNKGRLNRARDKGFLPTKPGDRTTVHFPPGHMKNWENIEDVEVQARTGRAYTIAMVPLESVDEENAVATTSVSARGSFSRLAGWVHNPSGSSVWVENILEALDEPGEWVVNTKSRKVYLWPSDPASNGSPQGILAPATTELIRVEGTIDYDAPEDISVIGIAFSGLTFTHADRWAWTNEEGRMGLGLQHDWEMADRPTAMLRFRGAEQCQVFDCRFINSGGTGIRLDLHAQHNRIVNCEFAHLGEAGILLDGYAPDTKDVNHHNDIINNHIHHFSEISWSSPGFWAWQSGYNHIAHNYIHHSGYSAVLISTRAGRRMNADGTPVLRSEIYSSAPLERRRRNPAGPDRRREGRDRTSNQQTVYERWLSGEPYSHSRHNLFEYNEISHSVQLLSDGNGIYISGAGRDNIIRYNYLHDNLQHSLPAAIRCDDGQHETHIYGNILYKNWGFSAGIASKGTNHIINNFIVAAQTVPFSGYISFEWVPVPNSKVYKNIIIPHPDGGTAHGERPRKDQTTNLPDLMETKMDSNLYYHPTDPDWMTEHFQRMQAGGLELASLFGDPLFTDPEGGDFSFKEGSPALELGIEPLDASKMGRVDPETFKLKQ